MATKKDFTGGLTGHPKRNPRQIDIPSQEETKTPDATPEKRKPGRPKTKQGEYKTINIAVPVEILTKMEIAKLKYGNNLTAYINAIIKDDLDANYEKYLELQTILNS